MADTALHFKNVSFGFGDGAPMFDGLNCKFENRSAGGKLIALMGPSGVGKSTFCDLALGTHKPASGAVGYSPKDAHVAVIPQRAVIFEELSIKENIACLRYSATLGSTFQQSRVEDAARALGLFHLMHNGARAATLSGGEAQRVMLARIQTVDCSVLILDEPCSFLDNRVKDSFLSAMRGTIDRLGLLALMVTHVWEETRKVADEVVFFDRRPGQAVRLHCSTIENAERRPPTVDALYAIHWPWVKLVERGVGTRSVSEPDGAPGDYRYRARFPTRANGNCSPLAPWAYYDVNGLLMDEAGGNL